MQSRTISTGKFGTRLSGVPRRWAAVALVAAIAALLLGTRPSSAQQGNEKTFASPGEAALAL